MALVYRLVILAREFITQVENQELSLFNSYHVLLYLTNVGASKGGWITEMKLKVRNLSGLPIHLLDRHCKV
jgi:hypothetical protein